MHFTVLTALQFPFASDLTKNNLLHIPTPMTIHDLVRIQGEFERDMTSIIDATMEPYYEATENPEYLVFEDMDKEVRSGYQNDKLDCVRMPNGEILASWDRPFTKHFTVEDGIVYERDWGPLHHKKRTKRAKQIKFLPNCPVRRLYKTKVRYLNQKQHIEANEIPKSSLLKGGVPGLSEDAALLFCRKASQPFRMRTLLTEGFTSPRCWNSSPTGIGKS